MLYGKTLRVTSWLQSKLLVITSLHTGAGDKTKKLASIGGVGSARLHLQPMFRAATALALNPRLLSLDVDQPSILSELGHPDLCVIGKVNHFDDSRVAGFSMATLAAVARLKSRNTKIVLLYCDHLAPLHCVRGSLYRDLLALSDQIIVPCRAMADRAKQFVCASAPITVIEDPWQVGLHPYKALEPRSTLRLGWFGNANNIVFLQAKIGELMSSIDSVTSVDLVILSNSAGLKKAEAAFNSSLHLAVRPWRLELVEWDDSLQPGQLEQVLGSVHVVWLPSNPESPIKGGVSHNRLVDAVRSGSLVVASSMQSYLELAPLALLGPDHGLLINNLVPEYNRLIAKHEALRSVLLKRFSPTLNLAHWQHLLKQMLTTCK